MSAFRDLLRWVQTGMSLTGLVSFDVVAQDVATAAHVAMWLRERLSTVMIRSEPDPKPSTDPVLQHVLRCHASAAGVGGDTIAHAIRAVLPELPALAGDEPRARVVLRGESVGAQAA